MLPADVLIKAYRLMSTARNMSDIYDANRTVCKYVHSTSRGHEAIQIATGLQLLNIDWVSPYYRDDSILLSIGFTPYDVMLQLLAKADDYFSGGRSYYCHPSSLLADRPKMIHQSSATGMQAIPTTGLAQGIQYLEQINSHLLNKGNNGELPIAVCSLGDNSVTEGEVSEALQFAALKQLPIVYLVQDNEWGISVSAAEARSMNAYEFAAGFKGLHRMQCDGSDFTESYNTIGEALAYARNERKPVLVRVSVPLLGHHTSGVRREFYRTKEDLEIHGERDPFIKLKKYLLENGLQQHVLDEIDAETKALVEADFENAKQQPEANASTVADHIFAPAAVTKESGERTPSNGKEILMVDAALFAIKELMAKYPEAVLYGQDVGRRLGGVFREAATLAEHFGDHRVFNTAIQEAYIAGSTIGLSALGIKPIVEVQFADYIYPALNQLITEISKSSYLSNGKFPVNMLLRVPIGAYGGGGPYHSGSVESTLLTVKGIKVVYPSNAADMKGLMKAAFLDSNPVIMFEHKGLYWSKVPGTEDAKTIEPAEDYVLPLGKGNVVVSASQEKIDNGESACVITYGMGVYWAKAAAKHFNGAIEIIDLRTLYPLDEELIYATAKKHGKVLVLTEEQQHNSFAESLGWRITNNCFQYLDDKVEVMGAMNLPAVPINLALEAAMLPNADKVRERLEKMLMC